MIPIVKQTYLSTVAATERVTYRCAACAVESGAVVSGVSQGYGEAMYFVGMKQAERESADQAAAGLPAALRRSIGLAGCPKCGARDPHERRKAMWSSLFRGLLAWPWVGVPLLLIAIAGIGYAVDELTLQAIGYGAAALIPFAVFVAIAARFAYRKLAREANMLAVWDDETVG